MSRDANGNYTLPVGNPVVTDTVIESDWANGTMNDLKTEITNSLDRQGRGGMLAPLKGVDGTKSTPAFSFTSEFGSGLYRNAENDFRFAINNTDVIVITPDVFSYNDTVLNVSEEAFIYDDTVLNVSDTAFIYKDGVLEVTDTTFTFNGGTVLVEGDVNASQIAYDNTIVGALPADNVQDAIDQLGAGTQTYSSVPHTGGGDLLAGVMNEILDGDTYDLPLASSTTINAQIGISLPSTAAAFKPTVQRKGTDAITWVDGIDTDMQFQTPATIWLTSNGVDTWRY